MKEEKKVRTEEWLAVSLSFIYFFSVLAAYYVVRPLREQLAAQVGSLELPWFFGATFIATLVLTPLFSWLVGSWPRRVVIPIVYLFFIGAQLLFIPFFVDRELLSPRTLGFLFFVWVSVFNLFVISVFWTFMTDIWSDAQARRLFPIIAYGGTAGAIVGPFLTKSLVESFGLAFLLILSAAFLVLALLCVVLLGRWASKHGVHRFETGSESALGGGIFDGLKQIFTDPFICQMALLMVLGDAIGTIAYVLVTDYSGATFADAKARTSFAATIDLSSNLLQACIQLAITPWLLVRGGAASVFGLSALLSALTCLGVALASDAHAPVIASLPWVAVMLIVTRSLAHSMVIPARETLYTLVPRDLRYKGKNAVDTVVWRAGDVASSLSINGLRVFVSIPGFGLLAAALISASGCLGWNLAKRVERGEYEDRT